MQPLAEIHMEVKGNEFPTLMEVRWKNLKKNESFTLFIPRYLPWSGWVEIFFLPPQEEWVELTGLQKFKGRLKGRVDEINFDEKMEMLKDLSKNYFGVKVERKFENGWFEDGFYFEVFNKNIKGYWISKHDNGFLFTQIEKQKLEDWKEWKGFVNAAKKRIEKEHELQVWRKDFKSIGKLPTWKRKFLPLNYFPQSGYSIEVGFLYIQGHGDWFKYFVYEDGRKFLVTEEGFEWDLYRMGNKETYGKRRYHLYLFEVRNLNFAINLLKI